MADMTPREEWDQHLAWRNAGMTWRDIAKAKGVSVRWAWKRGKELEAEFGERLPAVERCDKRDRARDFIRIKELREDAGLPWHMVGKALGMTGQYCAAHYAKLKQVYS